MNLLSNAVKYTNEGSIDFGVSADIFEDKATLKFIVKDTGIGIKKEDYDKIFVKFSRINNPENDHEIEGTGLGLVITKSLTELLGGTIDFESEYGVGTTFKVDIPQKIYFGAVQDSVSTINHGPLNVNNVHFDGSLYDVLIVDDNNLNLKVAERILSDYKFQITLASSGEEALEKIKNGARYDLIFLDHMMPGMDGIQTLKELKSLQGVKIPPVIALTANAMVGMKEMYLSEGFDGYISKPINREELQDLLNNTFCRK
jgi:CheY-like chemotaxis protein